MSALESSSQPSRSHRFFALACWILLCYSASASAAFVSTDGWYAELVKPPWNPPSWLFGPVWTLLYAMMAVAAWLVWNRGGWGHQRVALTLFVVQWFLNALWTPLFFGLHSPALALIEILVLWVVLSATLAAFWRTRAIAGVLLVPYLAWVTFAATLNFTIWQLNR